jgi:hypothetical protein
MSDTTLKSSINRAHGFCEEQQRLLEQHAITETEWFERHKKYFTEAYLAARDPRGQSGHGGDDARYRYTQGMLLDAIDRDGAFIDIGCANGYLMEMLTAWLAEKGRKIEAYGLDISPELVGLAKERLPLWKGRFFIGNALYWIPPRDFDIVCVRELSYVPHGKRQALLENLLENVVAARGRLIIGPYTEARDEPSLAAELTAWGHAPSGSVEKDHQDHAELVRRVLWLDAQG